MRYCVVALLLMLGGCGTAEVSDDARSVSEAYYMFKKSSGLVGEKALGKNPYDSNPQYRMVYCEKGGMQHWSSEAACLEAKGKVKPAK